MLIAADVQLGEGVMIAHRDLGHLYGCRVGAGTTIGTHVARGETVAGVPARALLRAGGAGA